MITIEEYRARIGCFCITHNYKKHLQKRQNRNRRKAMQKRKNRNQRKAKKKVKREKYNYSYDLFFQWQSFVLMMMFLVITLCTDMSFVRLLLLLLGGDIESNPGPSVNKIQKSVLGSFHQGHPKFGDTAGIQCLCNAVYAICFSVIKKVTLWKSFDLDYILENGDKSFKMLGHNRALFMSELPQRVLIENQNIEIEKLDHYYGLLGGKNIFENHPLVNDNGNGLLLMTGGFTIALIWSKNFVFLFDSHSRDTNGAFVIDGYSIALSFKSLFDIQNYIVSEYSKHISNFSETQFELQYIKVKGDIDFSITLKAITNNRQKVQKKESYTKILGTPKHEKIKKKQR